MWQPVLSPQELNGSSIAAREHDNISRGTTQTYLDSDYHICCTVLLSVEQNQEIFHMSKTLTYCL
jgi:hypothetical protein